jgi:hypothetical protein
MLQADPEQQIRPPSQPTSWQRQPAPDRRISHRYHAERMSLSVA